MAAEEFDIQKRYEKKKEEERKKEKGIVENKKKIVQVIKLQITPGAARPGPPIGPVLGQHQLNTSDFCKEFNKLTEKMDNTLVLPVLVFKKADRSFEMILKSPTTNFYKLKFQKLAKQFKGRVSFKDLMLNVISPKLVTMLESVNGATGSVYAGQSQLYKAVKIILGSLKSSKLKAHAYRGRA